MFGNKVSYDLQVDGVKIADIPVGGGLATAFVSPGKVFEDTISVVPSDPTKSHFFAQGESTPLVTVTKAGITEGAFRLFKVTAEVAADLLGGTITLGQYHAPRGYKGVERALQIIDGNGMPYTYPRCHLFAKVNGQFRTSEPNTIDITFSILMPEDSAVAPEIIGTKVEPEEEE